MRIVNKIQEDIQHLNNVIFMKIVLIDYLMKFKLVNRNKIIHLKFMRFSWMKVEWMSIINTMKDRDHHIYNKMTHLLQSAKRMFTKMNNQIYFRIKMKAIIKVSTAKTLASILKVMKTLVILVQLDKAKN